MVEERGTHRMSQRTATVRQIRALRTAMGSVIANALDDPEVVEVLLNPDGSLWIDRVGSGRSATGIHLSSNAAERLIRLVAIAMGVEVHSGAPSVCVELLERGERFEGVLPPIVRAPMFAIRKRAIGVIRLADYVREQILTQTQSDFLRQAIRTRLNILIAGGPATGKTTLANALLQEVAITKDRVIVLEDTLELQCIAEDHIPLRTQRGSVSMAELVRSTLRLRPDRIVVGEIRGTEALDLLNAWGTDYPGGIATIHAGSVLAALNQLEQLVLQTAATTPRSLIARTIGIVIYIGVRGRARRIEDIVRVGASTTKGYRLRCIP